MELEKNENPEVAINQKKLKIIQEAALMRTGADYKNELHKKVNIFLTVTGVLLALEVIIFSLFMFTPNLDSVLLAVKIVFTILWTFHIITVPIFTSNSRKVFKMSDLEAGKEKERIDKETEEAKRKREESRYE